MRLKPIYIFLLVVAIVTIPAVAESETGDPAPMDLKSCLELALANNPDLAGAAGAVDAAKARIEEQKGDYWPQVEAVAGISRWQQLAFLPDGLSIPGLSPIIGPTDDFSADIRASYTLYDSGGRAASVDMAKARAGAAGYNAESMARVVRLRVTEAYFRMLAATDSLQAVQNRLKRADDHLKLAEARYEIGTAPRLDVVRSRTEQAHVRQAIAEAKRQLAVAQGDLNLAMGRPAAEPLVIAPRPAVADDPAVEDVQAAVERALQRRSEVAQKEEQTAAARQEVKLAKSAFAPKVVASAAVGRRDTQFFPDEDTWSVGVNVRIPVFTGGKKKHRISASRSQVTVAEAKLDQVKLQVSQQVWNAHAGYTAAVEAAAAAESRVAEARESLRLVEERYKVNAATIHDVLDTEQALSDAEAAEVTAKWNVVIAKARYHWTIGDLSEVVSTL